jgi:hypothetical protein
MPCSSHITSRAAALSSAVASPSQLAHTPRAFDQIASIRIGSKVVDDGSAVNVGQQPGGSAQLLGQFGDRQKHAAGL